MMRSRITSIRKFLENEFIHFQHDFSCFAAGIKWRWNDIAIYSYNGKKYAFFFSVFFFAAVIKASTLFSKSRKVEEILLEILFVHINSVCWYFYPSCIFINFRDFHTLIEIVKKYSANCVGIFTAVQQKGDAAKASNRTKRNHIGETAVSIQVSFQWLEAFELGGSTR